MKKVEPIDHFLFSVMSSLEQFAPTGSSPVGRSHESRMHLAVVDVQ